MLSLANAKTRNNMSDAPAAKTKKVAPKKVAEHPKYSEMICTAIETLKNRKGSSKVAILAYLKGNFKVADNAGVHVKAALKRGVTAGSLVQVKGTGASGSFKVAKKEKVAKPKVVKAKKAVKKTPKKAAVKKVAVKAKSPKKTKKPAAKKPAAKKPAAKKAAKKPAKKPAAKKTAPKKKTPKKTAKK